MQVPDADAASRESGANERPRKWGWLVDIGAMGQAAIAGGYAWSVSVAPVAWQRGAPASAKLAAILAAASLLAGIVLERVSPPPPGGARIRPVVMWVFVLACAIVWLAVPEALEPARMNGTRGLASVIGWALFAHACAAPAVAPAPEARVEPGLVGRARISRFDGAAIVAAAIAALLLQVVGWSQAITERAVLLRVVTLACGLALVGGAATIASERHRVRRGGRAARAPVAWLAALVVLLVVGGAWVWLR